MKACMCTNQCPKCGACCQNGCACRSGFVTFTTPSSPPLPPVFTPNAKTCPTCNGSGKVAPA